jgi:flagellar basal body-associated protein FliL
MNAALALLQTTEDDGINIDDGTLVTILIVILIVVAIVAVASYIRRP